MIERLVAVAPITQPERDELSEAVREADPANKQQEEIQ